VSGYSFWACLLIYQCVIGNVMKCLLILFVSVTYEKFSRYHSRVRFKDSCYHSEKF